MSVHIKRLEDTYHTALFERKPSLKLTNVGKMLLETANMILEKEDALYNQLCAINSEFRGELAIGLPANRSAAFAAEFVPPFSEKYPNMTVSLHERMSLDIPTAVRQNEIDLAILLTAPGSDELDPIFFTTVPLGMEDLYVVISDALLKAYFPEQYPACKETFKAGVPHRGLRRPAQGGFDPSQTQVPLQSAARRHSDYLRQLPTPRLSGAVEG